MRKTLYIDFSDNFKFPKYHDEQNITVIDDEGKVETYTQSACYDCPFDYDNMRCKIGGKKRCPFYDGGDNAIIAVNPRNNSG